MKYLTNFKIKNKKKIEKYQPQQNQTEKAKITKLNLIFHIPSTFNNQPIRNQKKRIGRKQSK